MKELTSADNFLIYLACNGLRATTSILMAGSDLRNWGAANIVERLKVFGPHSELAKLIQQWKWEELFANQDWLDLLESADNLNTLRHGELTEHLGTLVRYFPEKDILFKKVEPASELVQ